MDGYIVRWRPVTDPESAWESSLVTGIDAETDLITTNTELTGLTNNQEYEVEVAAFHTPDFDTSAVT